MFSIPYGKGFLEFPDLWEGHAAVVSAGPFPHPDPESTVAEALDNPLGGVRLESLLQAGHRVACVIPDLTRRAAVKEYLPVLLKRISDTGVLTGDVTIIVALGIHRPLSGAELRELVGDRVMDEYRVLNHDPEGQGSNVRLGTTKAGIPVSINREVADADCVVLTGGVTYHYFAGYGGGRKSLMPGVASRDACEAHHKLVVSWRKGELKGDLAPGVLEDNPVHREMIEACSYLKSIFVLNVVTEPGGGIIAASAGDLQSAHLDACRKHDSWYMRQVAEPARLVLAGSGGYPRDINFVQAHKGLFTAHRVVRGSGVVILAAECPEGTGHQDFLDWFERCETERDWLGELQERYQINGQTAFSTWLRVNRVPTILVSRLKGSDVERMGMIPAADMKEAMEAAERILGELPVPLIMPDAGDMLPVITGKGEGTGSIEQGR